MNNLQRKTDRKQQTINYGYDALYRLTSKTYPDSTAVNYSYDPLSRLTQVTDPTGAYSFTYDNLGRLTGTGTQYSFLSTALTNNYGYDAASNRVSMTSSESGTTNYSYDSLNRLITLTDPNTGEFGFGYDALGRRISLTRPNGIDTSYSYDTLSRLLSVLHNSGSLPGSTGYTYDAAGNRLTKTAVQEASPNPVSVLSQFSYDNIYELTQAVVNGTTAESYSYDAVGNRTASAGTPTYSYNTSNELTSTSTASYTYDNNGNTTSKTDSTGPTYYAWDYENRLASVTLPGQGGTVYFNYDPFGRRSRKVFGSATTIYAYDGDNVTEELGGGGNLLAHYTQGAGIDEQLALTGTGGTYFYHADGLGSITSLTDGSAQLAASYVYDSFGKLTASTGTISNPFQYTGREFDSETGLYYYRARYYDSSTGRFIKEDPLQFGSGDVNFYVFVRNDPTDWVDRLGLRPGDKYPNERCAGWHAILDINQTSKRRIPGFPNGWEYGGWMYRNPDWTYSYTAPVPGGPAGVEPRNFRPIPRGTVMAGDYHTHGAYDPAFNGAGNPQPGQPGYNWHQDGNEVFSDGDERGNDVEHGPGFLGTPQGTPEEYIPRRGHPLAGRVIVLTPQNCGCQ